MEQTVQSLPGRKRSEQSRQAILAACWELVGEVGFAGLTVDGIAARAGCGKQTIYRWWPSKADVLLDALAAKADLYVPVVDHGSYQADLRRFLDATFALARRQDVIDVLRSLMAKAQIDADFGERFRSAFLQRRRDALREVLILAQERGDLPASPPADTVIDIVFGVLWYRLLATRRPVDAPLIDDLLLVLTAETSNHPTTSKTRR